MPNVAWPAYPHELSGGMRQRVAIAAALLTDPGLLIADEPTTALDVTMEAQIIHLLRELRRDFNGIIIVVSHHLGVIAELCDRVYVMYAGEVVEGGERRRDLPRRAEHPYTQALARLRPGALPRAPGPAADHCRQRCRAWPRRRPAASTRRAATAAFEPCTATSPDWTVLAADHAVRCHAVAP